jgi:hypothetical protein
MLWYKNKAVIKDKEVEYLNSKITSEEINNIRMDLGLLFELKKDMDYQFSEDKKWIQGPVVTVPENVGDRDLLVLLTRVNFIDDMVLNEMESGITHPYLAGELGYIKGGDVINFYYNLNQYPKMMYEKVDTEPDLLAKLQNL